MPKYIVEKLLDQKTCTNSVHMNSDWKYCKIKSSIFKIYKQTKVSKNGIQLNSLVRVKLEIAVGDPIDVDEFKPISCSRKIKEVYVNIKLRSQVTSPCYFSSKSIENQIKSLVDDYYLVGNHVFFSKLTNGTETYSCIVTIDCNNGNEGLVDDDTTISLESSDPNIVIMISEVKLKSEFFSRDFSFASHGIGGLDDSFLKAFRDAFATKAIDKRKMLKYGITEPKGMILYGPPGTGKTLIARKISGIISEIPPKIVNGPELLDKYVGESEKNVRELFQDAKQDYSSKGDYSPLHIIVIDEIDALCRARSNSGSSHVSDNVLTQLLTEIDGFEQLKNIFVIGMTNRIDLIDPAIKRAGRLEILVEIGLPSAPGRYDILKIHSKTMSDNSLLDSDVDFLKLAEITQHFSGAEIEALVKRAVSITIQEKLGNNVENNRDDDIIVTHKHFMIALETFKLYSKSTIKFPPHLLNVTTMPSDLQERLKEPLEIFRQQLKYANKHHIIILVYGDPKTGKTVLSNYVEINRDLNDGKYIKHIRSSSNCLLEMSDVQRANELLGSKMDCDKTHDSIMIIDDIDILLGRDLSFEDRFTNLRTMNSLFGVMKTNQSSPKFTLILLTSDKSTQRLLLKTNSVSTLINLNRATDNKSKPTIVYE